MSDNFPVQQITPGSLKSSKSRSVARLYPTGVSLVTLRRPDIATVSVQNLESVTSVQFWHGLIPADDPLAPTTYLPTDPADWTGAEDIIAESVLATYGETVKAGQYLEPFLAPTDILYSYVSSGTVRAHVKEG